MPRIIDCSVFFTENVLFRLRRSELAACVDTFVVAEATRTHAGGRKGIFFDRSPLDQQEGPPVVHFVVDDLPLVEHDTVANRWLPEQFQRNSLIRPLTRLGLDDNDVIIISDADEIPSSKAVLEAAALLKSYEVVVFVQKMRKFFVNNLSALWHNDMPWRGSVACKFGMMKHALPQAVRIGDPFSPRAACLNLGYGRALYPYEAEIGDGGWHFSSMGGVESYALKLRSIAESPQADRTEELWRPPSMSHNQRAFREAHRETIDKFLADHCPDLTSVDFDDPGSLASLDVPEAILSNPASFETLFYLNRPFS